MALNIVVPETESPIEALFLELIEPRLAPSTLLQPQAVVKTCCGNFRLDFLISNGPARIGIECDGAEFHQREARDEARDALILGTGQATSIFRFRGKDLVYRLNDCLYILHELHPRLFSERGGHTSERLGTDPIRNAFEHWHGETIRANYRDYDGDKGPPEIIITRRYFRRAEKHQYLREIFEFADKGQWASVDEMLEAWYVRAK